MSSLKRKLSVRETGAVKKMARAIVSGAAGRSRFAKTPNFGKMMEIKEFETSIFVNNQIGSGGSVQSLVSIPQGSDIKNRIGRHVNLLGLDISILITPQTIANFNYDMVYWAVVSDNQCNGSSPAYTDVYQSGTITQPVMEFRNTSQWRDRFTILWEERCWVSSNVSLTALGMQGDKLYFRKHINLKKKLGQNSRVEYNGSATGPGNSNGLFLVVSSFQNVAALSAIINAASKVTFTDP